MILTYSHRNVSFRFFGRWLHLLRPTFATAALLSLYNKLQDIKLDPSHYSDPRNLITFPFPFIYLQLPVDRFRFTQDYFEYMGRTVFSELWDIVQGLKSQTSTQLYIHGTTGHGKSHILAVLAGLLSRSGKRTVYLPDSRQLLANMVEYLQAALLCAFADPLSSDERERIRALKSEDDLKRFCNAHTPMYFIIDQVNALDDEDTNRDEISNLKKATVREYLVSLSSPHYKISSASANHQTALHMEHKQVGQLQRSLMGGMTKVSKCSSLYFFFRHLISILYL